MITEGLTAAIGQVNSVRVTKQDMIKNGEHCKTYLFSAIKIRDERYRSKENLKAKKGK